MIRLLPLCRSLSALFVGAALLSAQAPAPAKQANSVAHPYRDEDPNQPLTDETALRAQIALQPQSADLLYRLALLLRQKGDFRQSLQTYTQAAALAKPNADQLRSVALNYVQLNDFDDAIRWLHVANSQEPRNLDVLYSLGRCLYTQNQFADAQAAFERMLHLRPDHLKAKENLGLVLDAENHPAEAEVALRTAAQWAAERKLADAWPFLDLGGFLLDQGRAAEALPFLSQAAAVDANSAVAHERLGRALGATGDSAGAVRELEAAVRLDGQNPKIHFALGRAYREAGQTEKAQEAFQRSKALYGSHNQN